MYRLLFSLFSNINIQKGFLVCANNWYHNHIGFHCQNYDTIELVYVIYGTVLNGSVQRFQYSVFRIRVGFSERKYYNIFTRYIFIVCIQ